jgi:hypothetical protein
MDVLLQAKLQPAGTARSCFKEEMADDFSHDAPTRVASLQAFPALAFAGA